MSESLPKTLLIVEDNAIARMGMAAILRAHGYEVLLAQNGQQALDLLRAETRVDLVLLDMLMPVVDGWEFLNRLGGFPPNSALPIVVVTGSILTREWAESKGCAGFLKKPIAEGELLAEVQRVLGTTGGTP